MRRIGIAVVLATACGLLGAQGASAATTTVNCSGLQAALNSAASGDVIKLKQLCTGDSFTVANTNSFILEGVGTAGDGGPASGFNGSGTDSPLLGDPTNASLSMTIENLRFENNAIDANDGAAIDLVGKVTLTDDWFLNNSVNECDTCYGGAVYLDNSSSATNSITITSSRFSGNEADDGGAAYVVGNAPISITHNTFTGNSVASTSNTLFYKDGGAMDVEDYYGPSSSTVTISNNTFGGMAKGAGNSAPGWGGAVFAALSGGTGSGPVQTLNLNNNSFIDNQVTGAASNDHLGGAIAFDPQVDQYGFNVVQAHNLFQGNAVGGTNSDPSTDMAGGGAEWGTGTSIKSTADSFIDNTVAETSTSPAPEGGAVGVIGFVASIGGSLNTRLGSSFTGADDLFTGNSVTQAGGWGGAIYTGGSVANDCDDTTCPPSHLELYDSTLTGNSVNSSTGEGAAIWGGSKDSLTMDNSIVFGNTGASGAAEIFGYSGPKYSFDDACTTSGGTTPLSGADNICADPKLKSSGAEGSSSPTIDKGSNGLVPSGLTKDIAGHPRITEGLPNTCKAIVDMGAFESKAVKPAASCSPSVKPPHARILTPANGAKFARGDHVTTTFKCTGPEITSCQDSNGASAPHGVLNTSTVGRHTYTVTATNKKGKKATATINYTVGLLPAVTHGPFVKGENLHSGKKGVRKAPKLTCISSWKNGPVALSYRWYLNGKPAADTKKTFNVQTSDEGSTIACQVTAANAFGSTTKTSGNFTIASKIGSPAADQARSSFTG